jgi:hypothetical protein
MPPFDVETDEEQQRPEYQSSDFFQQVLRGSIPGTNLPKYIKTSPNSEVELLPQRSGAAVRGAMPMKTGETDTA